MMLEHLIRKEWGPCERKALWEDILRNNMISVLYEGVSTFQPILFDQWTKYTQHNESHNNADGTVVVQPMIEVNLGDILPVTLEFIEMKLLRLKQNDLHQTKLELPSLSTTSTTSTTMAPSVTTTLLPSLASAVGLQKPLTINATPSLESTCLPMITISGVDPSSTKKPSGDDSFLLSSNNNTNIDNTLLNPFWLVNSNNNNVNNNNISHITNPIINSSNNNCTYEHSPQSPTSPLSWDSSRVGSPLSNSTTSTRAVSVSPLSDIDKQSQPTSLLSSSSSSSSPSSSRVSKNEFTYHSYGNTEKMRVSSMMTVENSCSCRGGGEKMATESDEEFQITLIIYDSKKRDESAKPFECSYPSCGKRFSDRSNLMTHIRKHTQEKPFTCRVCGRGFSHKSTLRDHEHAHTGEQPYKCDKCGKCFSQKSNLQRHTKIHTGKMPYKCPLCNKTFNQSSNLKTHVNAKHHSHHNSITDSNPMSINSLNNLYSSSSLLSPSPSSPPSTLTLLSLPSSLPTSLKSSVNGVVTTTVTNAMNVSTLNNFGTVIAKPSFEPQINGQKSEVLPLFESVKSSGSFLPPISSSNSSSSSLTTSGSLADIPSSSMNSPRSQSPPLFNHGHQQSSYTSLSILS